MCGVWLARKADDHQVITGRHGWALLSRMAGALATADGIPHILEVCAGKGPLRRRNLMVDALGSLEACSTK
jgi:hypothetical protein